MNTVNASRRRFLQTSAVTGGGLVVGFTITGCYSAPAPLPVASTEGAWTPNAFLQVLPDNTIRFYTARSEMGQGVTTGLATLVGEELDVNPLDMDIINIVNAPSPAATAALSIASDICDKLRPDD